MIDKSVNSFFKRSSDFLLSKSIYLTFLYIAIPIIWAFIFGDFLDRDWEYWFVRIIIIVTIPSMLMILLISFIFGLRDTIQVITTIILSITITSSVSVMIFDEQFFFMKTDPILSFIVISITVAVLLSGVYRLYKYPERILPELKKIKAQVISGEKKIILPGKKHLQDKFFGDILSIMSYIDGENQKTYLKLKELNEDLSQEKFRFKSILETISDPIVVFTHNGSSLYTNKSFKQLYQTITSLELPNDFNLYDLCGIPFIDNIIKLITSKEENPTNFQPMDGIVLQPQIIHIFLPNTNQPISAMIQFRDITKFQEFENIRKQFVSTVSHELRTPITGITLSIHNILKYKEKMSESQLTETLVMIKDSSEILNNIIEDLLIISRIESGKIVIDWKRIDLKIVIHETFKQLEPKSKSKNIFIEQHIEQNLIIFGDYSRINQIIRIFIDNAIKYSQDSGVVTIRGINSYKGEFNPEELEGVLIQIIDNGIGIKQKELPFLFDRFFRSSEVVNLPGTGLGLSIAKDLIELHNGEVFVRSKYKEGTKISVFLPTNDDNNHKN